MYLLICSLFSYLRKLKIFDAANLLCFYISVKEDSDELSSLLEGQRLGADPFGIGRHLSVANLAPAACWPTVQSKLICHLSAKDFIALQRDLDHPLGQACDLLSLLYLDRNL